MRNLPFLISDIEAIWRSVQSARMSEIINGRLYAFMALNIQSVNAWRHWALKG